VVGISKCLTYSTRQEGIDACSNGGCSHGPASPPAYEAARIQFKTAGADGTNESFDNYGADCGNFVATVMRMSGVDPGYPISSVGAQATYMFNHPELYQRVGTSGSSAGNLQPGDIITNEGHTLIYIGDGKVAQASQGEQMPVQEAWWGMIGVVWRLK
jgi:cell wall-associated NlpC family hydrolase